MSKTWNKIKCVIGMKHQHCWHLYSGPIWMVIPDGSVIEKCCGCDETRIYQNRFFGTDKWVWIGKGPKVSMSV